MAVPAIALYASPLNTVCSTPHPCQINSHDFDLNCRSSSASTASTSPLPLHKPIVGGLSLLLSSTPAVKHVNYSGPTEELGSSMWHDRGGDEFGSGSFRYSSLSSSLKRDQFYQSPVSVLQVPVSYSTSSGIGSIPTSRSPSMRIGENITSIRSVSRGLFSGFVRHALGSYVDYDSTCFEIPKDLDSTDGSVDDLTFNMEDNFPESDIDPSAKRLLLDAQGRHKIFCDEFVIKAFYEAEKAHREQVRFASVLAYSLWLSNCTLTD